MIIARDTVAAPNALKAYAIIKKERYFGICFFCSTMGKTSAAIHATTAPANVPMPAQTAMLSANGITDVKVNAVSFISETDLLFKISTP